MSREITQRELRNGSGRIMRELDAGATFIVTRNGVPVGELAPLRRHRFVAVETAVALFRAAPTVSYERFRAGLDDHAPADATPILEPRRPRGVLDTSVVIDLDRLDPIAASDRGRGQCHHHGGARRRPIRNERP